MKLKDRQTLDRIFAPRGLALFGGVGTPGSFGSLIALSQIQYGYRGELYPISEKGGQIAGRRIFRNLDEIDGPVDLASISVPAKAVPPILRDCLRHGLAGAQVHTSGFAEVGTREGIALQAEIVEIARRGLRIVGPNCFGIHCPHGGITLLPGTDYSKESGPIAFVSQSGGVATDFGYEAKSCGLNLSKIVSYGNGCDLEAIELFDYLGEDPQTECIAAYIEGVKDGRRFLETVRRVSASKPVVIWKSGLTPLGGQAARGHTGSMAGEAQIWSGALAQAGAVCVQGLDEIMDAVVGLRYLKKPGRRIALIGGGGAIGVFSCDLAHRLGLSFPEFSSETQKQLRQLFPTPGNSMANPLDTGSPVIPIETIKASAEIILNSEPVDVLLMVLLLRPLEIEVHTFMKMTGMDPPQRGEYLKQMLEVLSELKAETGKDIVAIFGNRAHQVDEIDVEKISREMRAEYQSMGIPVFPDPKRALKAIAHVVGPRPA